MCIEGMNPMATSAKTEVLTMDKLADSTESSFNYASIFKMLQHLHLQSVNAIYILQ